MEQAEIDTKAAELVFRIRMRERAEIVLEKELGRQGYASWQNEKKIAKTIKRCLWWKNTVGYTPEELKHEAKGYVVRGLVKLTNWVISL